MATGGNVGDPDPAANGEGTPDVGDPDPAANGEGTPEAAGTKEGGDKPPQITVNRWQFVSLVAVLITLVVVLVFAFGFKGTTDSVTGIIGATLPPFATIAAAIFGVKAIFDTGKVAGDATGKAEGEKNKDEAVKDAADKAARAITQPLRESAPEGPRELVSSLRRGLESPQGYDGLQLFGPGPTASPIVSLSSDLLERAERPSREVETALAIAEQYIRR